MPPFFLKERWFFLKDKPRVASSCFAKGKPSFRPRLEMEKPSSCGLQKAGEVLGLHATVTSKPYDLTVETMQPCQLNFVGREDFLRFLKDHGDACLHAAQHIGRDYQDACNVVRSVGLSHTISERLAKFLLESSAEGQVANGVVRTKLALSHEDIAQLIGTSWESISRTLARFRKLEIVELKGSALIIRTKTALGKLVAA
jgi:CRP/FNR family transcriptional regulator, cyclic AMP receptor protein